MYRGDVTTIIGVILMLGFIGLFIYLFVIRSTKQTTKKTNSKPPNPIVTRPPPIGESSCKLDDSAWYDIDVKSQELFPTNPELGTVWANTIISSLNEECESGMLSGMKDYNSEVESCNNVTRMDEVDNTLKKFCEMR